MTRDKRRFISQLKDKKRRKLYLNHSINGRFEVSDESVEVPSGYMNNKAFRSTLNPIRDYDKIKSGRGHWAEYPKNKHYGSRGYDLKHKTKEDRILEDKYTDELEGSY